MECKTTSLGRGVTKICVQCMLCRSGRLSKKCNFVSRTRPQEPIYTQISHSLTQVTGPTRRQAFFMDGYVGFQSGVRWLSTPSEENIGVFMSFEFKKMLSLQFSSQIYHKQFFMGAPQKFCFLLFSFLSFSFLLFSLKTNGNDICTPGQDTRVQHSAATVPLFF